MDGSSKQQGRIGWGG
jgi:hypothetical protein